MVKVMKKAEYIPYNFDIKYEYETYKNVGKDCEVQFRAVRSRFYKIYKKIRDWKNKGEKKYKRIDRYSQWEVYIKEKIRDYFYDPTDFKHYLLKRERVCRLSATFWQASIIPILVGMISIISSIYMSISLPYFLGAFACSLMLIYTFVKTMKTQFYYEGKSFFFKDVIEILEKNKYNKK